jgi:hypothetical protein
MVQYIAHLHQENHLEALPQRQGLQVLQDYGALMDLAAKWNTYPLYVTQQLGHNNYPYNPTCKNCKIAIKKYSHCNSAHP